MSHDVIVLGGGPAGTAAATELSRRGLDVAVVDPLGFGGRLVNIDVVRDGPGSPDGHGPAGWDLGASLGEDAMAAGVAAIFGRAEQVQQTDAGWRVTVDGDEHEAAAVLLATGCGNRPVPGDEDAALVGRGVSYCAVCDAALFAGRPVVVAGGDVWAWAEVLTLAPLASSVVWVDGASASASASAGLDALGPLDNVRVVRDGAVRAVLVNGSMVRAVDVVHLPSGHHEVIEVVAVFGADADRANTGPVAAIAACDDAGFVLTDANFACPGRPGLFAAGDVRSGANRSVAAALADGAAAAAAIADFLHHAGHSTR